MSEQLSAASRPTVAVRGLEKTFAGTRALRGVDIDFMPGEIHAVCGGNGSGKSTMIKILSGVYQADEGGTVLFDGETVPADKINPTTAHRLGVRVVHQDLAVFPELTVAENLCIDQALVHGPMGNIRWRKVRDTAGRLIEEFEIAADPRTRLRDLSLATRTQVAIARSFRDRQGSSRGLLILDEPTAALPVHEVHTLLAALKRLAAQGQSILYVSHRLDEVLDLADRVSILRDGRLVGTYPAAELTEASLIERMLGRTVENSLEQHGPVQEGRTVLSIRDLVCGPLLGANLDLRAGEVVGIAGLMGSGRSTLLRCVFGAADPESGTITLADRSHAPRAVGAAVRAGIAMVPEHRVRDAAFMDHSLSMNLAVGQYRRYWRNLFMRDRTLRNDSDDLVGEFSVKANSSQPMMASLSGGNQQKVVLARWLRSKPQILLLDEPTQGVDVGARADIYQIVRKAAREGSASIVVASDFEELAMVVDRALVLRKGRIVADVSGPELNAARLTELSYSDAA
jgi:ribose transport system ATP-binding protein